jgi:hypothetical protein
MDTPQLEIMTKVRTKQGTTPGRMITYSMEGTISDCSPTRNGYRYNVMISPEEWNKHHHRKTDQIEILRFYNDEVEVIT